jgi:hypothetical protein
MKLTRGRKAAILVGLVVFIVGVSTSASYALWSVNNTNSGTVNAGTISLTANGSSTTTALTGLSNTSSGPGTTATQPVTIANTGTLPLTYTTVLTTSESPTSAAVIGNNIAYTAWIATTANPCTTTSTAVSTWTGTLDTGTKNLGAGRALAAGTSEVLCVRTKMSTTAPTTVQGQSVSATLTFTGSST